MASRQPEEAAELLQEFEEEERAERLVNGRDAREEIPDVNLPVHVVCDAPEEARRDVDDPPGGARHSPR